MRIAHVSDFHYTRITWNPFRLFSKRILGNLNWIFTRKDHFSEAQIAPLPSLFDELGVDLVLFGGDFSTTAMLEEFEAAKKFVAEIKQPWLAIPGNHDHYTYRSYREKHFYRYFKNQKKEIKQPIDFFNLSDHKVEARQINDHWWVISLDTARATNLYSSQGLFSEKQETYLKEVLSLIPEDHSILFFNHYPFFHHDNPRRQLERGKALQKILADDRRIRLYLHGHTHRHTVADVQPNGLPLVLDSGSVAQCKKGAWNLIDLTDDGCKVHTYRWDHHWKKHAVDEIQWTRK